MFIDVSQVEPSNEHNFIFIEKIVLSVLRDKTVLYIFRYVQLSLSTYCIP